MIVNDNRILVVNANELQVRSFTEVQRAPWVSTLSKMVLQRRGKMTEARITSNVMPLDPPKW